MTPKRIMWYFLTVFSLILALIGAYSAYGSESWFGLLCCSVWLIIILVVWYSLDRIHRGLVLILDQFADSLATMKTFEKVKKSD